MKLHRTKNAPIAGVCGGIAKYYGWDPTIVRIVLFLLLFGYGFGALPYVILWIIMPREK